MNCTMFVESVEALLDGEVEGAERAQMEGHAVECEACRKQLALSRKAREAMNSFVAPRAPAGFARGVAESTTPVFFFGRSRWRVAAAAAFLVAGAGLGAYMLLSAEGMKDPSESPIVQEAPKAQPAEEAPLVREPVELAQAPAPKATTAPAAPAVSEDEEIAANLGILENWDLLNDPDVAVALALPDEDFELLVSALEEGM